MFILFGWGFRTTKALGPTLPVVCPHCTKEVWLHLVSYRTWFTLFFIPIVPYASRTLLLCPVCSRGMELHAEDRERVERLNRLARAFLADEMEEGEYLEAAKQIRLPA